ncbi:hypothetical protein K8R33_03700 [archaeon]|nr:hypothetical protein [archaeon]
MFGLKYEDIVEKILKEKEISKEDLDEKINEKISQLSDLISKEGAAQIVANQLGVKMSEDLTGKRLKIKEIPKGVGSVNAVGKVLQMYGVREFNKNGRSGKVANIVIGDETATIRVVMWDEKLISEIEEGNLNEGDILKVRNAYSRVNNGYNELHLGNKAQMEINPKGEKIGEVQNQVLERPSAEVCKICELKEGMFAELQGTVVQLFEPRHYLACPECNRKVLPDGSCKTHGAVSARKSSIVNIFFDDGSNNIRVVCFSNQAEQLLGCKNDKIAEASSEIFEGFKKEVLGKQLSISGRVTKNTMFDRLEFTSSDIKALDPAKMIEICD